MFEVARTEPVRALTREQLWRGLVRKAEFPEPFVRAITASRVLRRDGRELEREVVLRGDRVRERVTFEPGVAVHFERLTGPAWGTIENRIVEDDRGGLGLRFTFRFEVEGLAPGSVEECAFAERMGASYLAAVRTTLRATEALVARGGAA
jgi:hypothetical protein